jgi:tetratricopeptide (TPR) repeat protein
MPGTPAKNLLRTLGLSLAIFGLVLLAGRADGMEHGQPATISQKDAAREGDALALVRDVAGRNLARIVLADLALQVPPQNRDHQLAADVLGICQEWMNDESVIRWRLGAANAADDRKLSIELCRELLRRDPRDEMIQYRLISLQLEEITTAEDRLARIQRFFTAQGARLSPVVLSRVALDGAVLSQQVGDDAGFVEMLKHATSLDSTNRDAAAAAAAYFSERIDDPIGRLELLANLLLAEPTDPETQVAIGRELAALGAFQEAKRFQDNVARMLETGRIPESGQLARERLFTRWGIEGPQVVVNALNNQIEGFRIQAKAQREQAEKSLLSTEDIPKPEDVRLEVLTERLRLIAAVSAGDKKTTDTSALDLRASTASRIYELGDPKMRPQEVSEARAVELTKLLRLGVLEALCWANTYAGPRIALAEGETAPTDQPAESFESALAELEDLAAKENFADDDLDYRVTRGWCLLRAGRTDEAIADFEYVGDRRAGAQTGLAEAYTLNNQPEKAMAACRLIWTSMPMTLEAMYAYSAMRKLTGRDDVDPDMIRRARSFAAGIPAWIDRVGDGGHTFMTLEVEVEPARTNGLERTAMKIRLRNTAPVPLGVGSDRALNSQLLIGSSMEVGISNIRAYLSPEVTTVGRRYRLMPNEYVEFKYWPEAGSAGWVTDECCDRLVRQRWRIIQGYSQAEDGVISTGPLCLSRESNTLTRNPLPVNAHSNRQLADSLATAAEDQLPAIVSVVRARLLNPMDDRVTMLPIKMPPQEIEAIAGAAADRYASLSPEARMLLCTVFPQAAIVPEMKAFDDAARTETDPTVLSVVLLTRVTESNDPLFASAKASTDARLARIATILEERNAEGVAGYADRGGPDVRGIMDDSKPPTPGGSFGGGR